MILSFNIKRYEKDRWYLFSLFCLLNILFLYLINDVIITDPQYFTGGNENSVNLFRKVYTVIYFISPIYVFIKMVFFTLLLKIGAALYCNLQIEFKKLFTLVVLSGFVLLIPDLIEVIWFLLIHTDYTMEEVKFFYPFSVYSLFNHMQVSDSYKFPLILLNPFELAYWFMLISGLGSLGTKTRLNGLKIVAGSYGVFLISIFMLRLVLLANHLSPFL